ncbi:MAG: hypothetical protein IKC38_07020 [Clostridia bacterium]|nr:hypothetical protein [Clostridia bacterium]
MGIYKIAGLYVEMDSYGRTLEQSIPYQIDSCPGIDIKVHSDIQYVKNLFPRLSDDDCEYLSTGKSFYTQLFNFDGFMLHSSAVVVDNKAYLFTANSGTGKSTHTSLWLQHFGQRAYIINDDKPALRLEDGIWYVYGTPWSGKHDISVNKRVPLAGIACLERGETNTIEPFGGVQAIGAILKQSTKSTEVEHRIKILELLDQLLTKVPVWKLKCNMEPEAVRLSYEAMSGRKLEDSNED